MKGSVDKGVENRGQSPQKSSAERCQFAIKIGDPVERVIHLNRISTSHEYRDV